MDNIQITTHAQLLKQIEELKAIKDVQEQELKNTFRTTIASIDLISIFKGSVSGSGDHPLEFAKRGVNMVMNLIIALVLGKNRSIKGFLSALLIEKFTSSLINNNLMGIISTISSLINRKSQYEKSQEFNQ